MKPFFDGFKRTNWQAEIFPTISIQVSSFFSSSWKVTQPTNNVPIANWQEQSTQIDLNSIFSKFRDFVHRVNKFSWHLSKLSLIVLWVLLLTAILITLYTVSSCTNDNLPFNIVIHAYIINNMKERIHFLWWDRHCLFTMKWIQLCTKLFHIRSLNSVFIATYLCPRFPFPSHFCWFFLLKAHTFQRRTNMLKSWKKKW